MHGKQIFLGLKLSMLSIHCGSCLHVACMQTRVHFSQKWQIHVHALETIIDYAMCTAKER